MSFTHPDTHISDGWLCYCTEYFSPQAWATLHNWTTNQSSCRHCTSLNYCHTFTDSEELTQPVSSDMNFGLLLTCAMPHTRAHTLRKKKKNMCVLAADPPWCLIPPHFLRPLLLSNWGSGEYNYGENHPGLMWGRINGIKKIICWPSGPSAVWGWEGNLKPREEEIVGFNERADESLWPPRGSLGVPLGDYFLQDSPT